MLLHELYKSTLLGAGSTCSKLLSQTTVRCQGNIERSPLLSGQLETRQPRARVSWRPVKRRTEPIGADQYLETAGQSRFYDGGCLQRTVHHHNWHVCQRHFRTAWKQLALCMCYSILPNPCPTSPIRVLLYNIMLSYYVLIDFVFLNFRGIC